MERQNTHRPTWYLLLALAIIVATGCASTPSKYKKKKGCDCPKWNHRLTPSERPIHANLGRRTTLWPLLQAERSGLDII
jgi:hypothetical protein